MFRLQYSFNLRRFQIIEPSKNEQPMHYPEDNGNFVNTVNSTEGIYRDIAWIAHFWNEGLC